MKHLSLLALTAAFTVFTVSGAALADLPPPDDYVETCTVDQQQGADDTCVSCQVTYEDFNACANTYEPDGYTKRCQTWGASVYDEVFCKAGATPGSGGSAGSGPTPEASGGSPAATGGATAPGSAATTGGTETTGGTATTAEPSSSNSSDAGGCSVSHRSTSGGALWLALLGLALGLRRRR